MTSPTPHTAENSWNGWLDASLAKYGSEVLPNDAPPIDDRPFGWEDGPATGVVDEFPGLCYLCHAHPARVSAATYITFLEGSCASPYERMTLRLCYTCYRHFGNEAVDLEPIECSNVDCPSQVCQQIKKSSLHSS